ncbi:sugar ABC transporter substrate-binding protein [Pendulispora rubella]|uniref:Sugar ABC transporter substrate-binding protein n=1 Tax=Pendulispora rubella TaxID=2741070 RepID=A0ABZ2KSC1_9BACT
MSDSQKKSFWIRALVAVAFAALCVGVVMAFREPRDKAGRDPGGSTGAGAGASREGSGKRLVFLTITPHARSAEAAVKAFEKETGNVFQVKVVNYEEVGATIQKDHASNAPQIDVFALFYNDLVPLVSQGAAMDLTDFIEQNKAIIKPDDFIPGLFDVYSSYKGRRWALPIDADTHVLFYRKSLLAKHRLTPPDTWDDYLNVARTITERESSKGIYGAAIMASPAPILIVSSFMNRLAAFGGELLDREGHPTVNSPEAVAALEAMMEHARYALPTPLETDFDVSRSAFLSGRVAMVEQWTDIGVMAEDGSQSTIQGDWGVVPMPKGRGPKARRASALNGGFSVAVSSKSKEPELARAFVRFITRPDTLLTLNLMQGGLDPARLSVLRSPEFKKFAPEVSAIEQISLTQPMVAWPSLPQTRTLMDALSEKLVKAMEHHMTARQALDAVQAQWTQALAAADAAP